MNSKSSLVRRALSAALIVAFVSSAGCSWFRGNSGYENSPESRPLEVPPDLNTPTADPSMQVPAVAGVASPTRARAPLTSQSFIIADAPASAWRRLGLALERIEGVTIDSRGELLSVYNVSFQGESFLVKIAADGEASRVSTASSEGIELTTGAAGKLLALLKSRLG